MASSKRPYSDSSPLDACDIPGQTADTTVAAANRVAAAAADIADRATEAVSSAAGKIKEKSEEALHRARDAGRSAVRTAERQVESHPLSSVGIAFAAGLVVGVVIDRLISRE